MKRKIKRPITRRFLAYIMAMIMISNVLLFGILSVIYKKNVEKQVTESSVSMLQRNLKEVNRYLEGIDDAANSLIYNQELVEILKKKDPSLSDLNLLDSIFSIFYQSRNDLKLVLYTEADPQKLYSIYSGDGKNDTGNFHNTEWFDRISKSDKNRIMISNQIAAYTEGVDREYVHVMIYKIRDRYDNKCVGYLRVDIDLQNLKEYFISDYGDIDGTSIYDEQGNLLFQDKMVVEIDPGKEIAGENSGQKIFQYQDQDYITVYGDVSDIGWKMAVTISKDRIFSSLEYTMMVFFGILICVLLVTVACSGRLFSVITDNFKRLAMGMESVKQGNLQTRVVSSQEDEVGILIEEFNETVKNLNVLMDEVKKKQTLLKEAEMKALQQQINPHFIFNALETVIGLASEGMNQKVITVCKGMSAMLRYNISFQNRTKLQNEITQMKNYIKIMQIRFEGRFEVFYDIEKECLDAEFVKFVLQPLVENAISHGLGECSGGGIIRIRIKRQESQVAISIFDNGKGMEAELLQEINRKIHEIIEHPLDYVDEYQGLGLMNVNLRLRLHFKEEYFIEIFSKPGRGTCIYIKIPYRQG